MKVGLSLVISLIAIDLVLHAKENAQTKPEIVLEMIYELDSAKLHHGNVLISEVRDRLRKKSEDIPRKDIDWVLNKLRLDIIRQTKTLYTDTGKEIEIPYFAKYPAKVPHSSNYEYFILNTCDYEHGTPTKQVTKLIKTHDGNVLWEISNQMMLCAFISNDGNVTIDATDAVAPRVERNLKNVRFYDKTGNLVKTAGDLLSFSMWTAMADIGNLFVAMSGKDGSYLICFDGQGDELWRTPVPGIEVKISFFNSNKFLIYTSLDGHTLLIDDTGEIIGDYDFTIREGTFTDDNEYFIFDKIADSVYYLKTQNGDIFCDKITGTPGKNVQYYFVDMFDKLDAEGVVMLDKSGAICAVYIEQGVVSPNKHIIVTPKGIYLLEMKNAE